jgi:hypothetical protein
MKKVILSLVVVFVMSSFTTVNTSVEKANEEKVTVSEVSINTTSFDNIAEESYLQIEVISEDASIDRVKCKWRTCTYVNGELQGCSEWTYGECDKDSNGKLTKVE